jgi:RecQ mediated genome instability protein
VKLIISLGTRLHFAFVCINNAMAGLPAQAVLHFASKQLSVSQTFLSALLTSIEPRPLTLTPPIFATLHTAFLNSSLQQSSSPEGYLPASIPSQHNTSITGPALVQIIHVQDIGTSRLAQLDALEKALLEAGPQGLRVVDLPADDDGEDATPQNGVVNGLNVGKSICKVLLEDGRGQRVYGMEVKPIEGIKVGMSLGCKVSIAGKV